MGTFRAILVSALAVGSATPALAHKGATGHVAASVVFQQYALGVSEREEATGGRPPGEVSYAADVPLALGVEASWRGFGGSYAVSVPDEEKSRLEALELAYFFSRVGVDVSRVVVLGAAREDAADSAAGFRSDLRVETRGANLWASLVGLNLDLPSLFDPASLPRGSGLALLAIGSYDEMRLEAPGGLVSSDVAGAFVEEGGVHEARFRAANAQLGVAGVASVLGLHAGAMVAAGGGRQWGVYRLGEDEREGSRAAQKVSLYGVAGYKGPAGFLLADLQLDNPSYALREVELDTTRGYVRIIVGVRF